jgi:hypothetical protein
VSSAITEDSETNKGASFAIKDDSKTNDGGCPAA